MKKIALVAACAVVFAASPALAETDILKLNGTVDYQCSLQLDAQTSSTIVSNDNYQDSLIGTMDIECNDPEGFTLDVNTSNNFELVGENAAFQYGLRLTDGVNLARDFGDNGDATFQQGFVSAYAEGTTAEIEFVPVQNQEAVPGGVPLTDTVTFEITG